MASSSSSAVTEMETVPSCTICDTQITMPITIGQTCGHAFCVPCGITLFQNSVSLSGQYATSSSVWTIPKCTAKRLVCPLCRDKHAHEELVLTPPMHWVHPTLKVCVFCTSFQSDDYPALVSHMNACPSRWIRCPACKNAIALNDTPDSQHGYCHRLQLHLNAECKELSHQCGGCWRRGTKEAATRCAEVHNALHAIDFALSHVQLEIEALRQMDGDNSRRAGSNNALIATSRNMLIQLSASFGIRQPVSNPEFVELAQATAETVPLPNDDDDDTEDEDDEDDDEQEEDVPAAAAPAQPPQPPQQPPPPPPGL